MAGEMHAIDPATGHDSNGECWPLHLAVAQAVGGTLRPFDAYQGPYIAIGRDLRAGVAPYEVPVAAPAGTRLWLQSADGVVGAVIREDTGAQSEPFLLHHPDTAECAVAAALALLAASPHRAH